ncbi:MAG: hypothetical protein B6240_03665, partial [Desulfobacteraceae bacterium 4572_87]
ALKRFIEENMNNEQESPYQKVKHLLGTTESGIKDIGKRHREHLVGIGKRHREHLVGKIRKVM